MSERPAEELMLPDGRRLAWCEWGDREGAPVVLMHGMPGSRLFRPDDAVLRDLHIRLVTYDRAGTGRSDPMTSQPALLDCVPDALALVDHLAIERFGLLGWSGGGCFATAIAYAAPARVARLALVSAPGPLDEVPDAWENLGGYMRPTAEASRRDAERARRAIFRHMADYRENPVSFLGSGRGPDGPILADPIAGPMLRAQIVEALSGADGYASDLVAHWLPWGFGLADVRVPTAVWHAAADPHNGEDARTYAARIPGATLTVWPDVGHLGIVRHFAEVLAFARG